MHVHICSLCTFRKAKIAVTTVGYYRQHTSCSSHDWRSLVTMVGTLQQWCFSCHPWITSSQLPLSAALLLL